VGEKHNLEQNSQGILVMLQNIGVNENRPNISDFTKSKAEFNRL